MVLTARSWSPAGCAWRAISKARPFPGWAKKAERIEVLKAAKAAVMQLPTMQDAFSENLEALSPLEKQVLVERHLISREHAAKGVGSAVVMNAAQSLSFMINEEDHLRMQAICSRSAARKGLHDDQPGRQRARAPARFCLPFRSSAI